MQGRKLIITSIITLLASGGGFYLYKIADKSPQSVSEVKGNKVLPQKPPGKKGKKKKSI